MEKLLETKNDLINQIKQKDNAIVELSKFYDVSIIIYLCLEIYGTKE